MENNVSELVVKCNYCKREILDEMAYYKHPKYGIVCERCKPFEDGGIAVTDSDSE